MKVKVTLSGHSPHGVVQAINSPTVVDQLLKKVLQELLGVEEAGEADFFVLPSEMAIPRVHARVHCPQKFGCHVKLSGFAFGQHNKDFAYDDVAKKMVEIYKKVIETRLSKTAEFTVKADFKCNMGLGESRSGLHEETFNGSMVPPVNPNQSFRSGRQPNNRRAGYGERC